MDVDESVARQITTYQGQIHYFCAPGCKKAFEAEPQKYLDPNYAPPPEPVRDARMSSMVAHESCETSRARALSGPPVQLVSPTRA